MDASQIASGLIKEYPADSSSRSFPKMKRGGEHRLIVEPNKHLASWLKHVNAKMAPLVQWPDCMHGGIKGRSIVSFASPHVGAPWVITIDIANCFSSLKKRHVSRALCDHLELGTRLSHELSKKLTFRGTLAQGFATSNFICNLILLDTVSNLQGIFDRLGYTFTNYVDDFAISGDIIDPASTINLVALALSRAGLSVKKPAVRVMKSSMKQEICGLVVNRKLAISREKKSQLVRDIVGGHMEPQTVEGWLAHLKSVDSGFESKLRRLARSHGLV